MSNNLDCRASRGVIAALILVLTCLMVVGMLCISANAIGGQGMEEYMPKGGMGMLRPGLFVEVTSQENALILPSGQKWVGRKSDKREVALFWRESVVSPTALPDDFSLSETVVISFETDRIVYRDFKRGKEGFYRRIRPVGK